MDGGSGVTRNIIDEFHHWDIEGDQMEGESGVTRRIIDNLHSSDLQRYPIEGESGVTRSIIDDFILRGSNKIKWNLKVVLLKV